MEDKRQSIRNWVEFVLALSDQASRTVVVGREGLNLVDEEQLKQLADSAVRAIHTAMRDSAAARQRFCAAAARGGLSTGGISRAGRCVNAARGKGWTGYRRMWPRWIIKATYSRNPISHPMNWSSSRLER